MDVKYPGNPGASGTIYEDVNGNRFCVFISPCLYRYDYTPENGVCKGLSYQWYLKNKTASAFSKSSIKTSTYAVTMSDTVDGRQLYCVVKDKFGNKVTTNTVTVSKYIPMSIVKLPQNAKVANGVKATTTVEAKGSGLTYQWYVKNKGDKQFGRSSITTKTYSVIMSDAVDGCQVYCVITDAKGAYMTTNTVTLSKK